MFHKNSRYIPRCKILATVLYIGIKTPLYLDNNTVLRSTLIYNITKIAPFLVLCCYLIQAGSALKLLQKSISNVIFYLLKN